MNINLKILKIASIVVFILSLVLILNSYNIALSTAHTKFDFDGAASTWEYQYLIIAHFIIYLVIGIILCITSFITFIYDIHFINENTFLNSKLSNFIENIKEINK